ncbi:MAG: cytochrome c3 family protein [Nitrospirota bacterium]|jgi:predicted CXXCH cytochrome family protein
MKRFGPVLRVFPAMAVALVFSFPGRAAIVSDDCAACHALVPGLMGEAPIEGASNAQCVTCHSSEGANTIKMMGGVRVPVVYNVDNPLEPLAGGNFHGLTVRSLDGSEERRGHNVRDVVGPDGTYTGLPPGYMREHDLSAVGYQGSRRLACAGSNGCHGDRNIEDPLEAVRGSHHAPDSPVDGSTTARSYRYLRNTALVQGVEGLEDKDWERTTSTSDHNEYSTDINAFCANCHGDIHFGHRARRSPWFRHPTGIALPRRGEYESYSIYNTTAPVGRPTIPNSPSATVQPGTDVVICLSCHRAHGSPYAGALRWNYEDFFVGRGESGCFVCHTRKASQAK